MSSRSMSTVESTGGRCPDDPVTAYVRVADEVAPEAPVQNGFILSVLPRMGREAD